MTQTRIPSAAPLATTHTLPIDPSLDRRTTQAEAALGCAGPQDGRTVADVVVVSRQLVVCGREVFCVACRRRRRQRGSTRSLTHAHTEGGREGGRGRIPGCPCRPPPVARSVGGRRGGAGGKREPTADAPSARARFSLGRRFRRRRPSARLQGGSLPERDGGHAGERESVRSSGHRTVKDRLNASTILVGRRWYQRKDANART